MDLIFINGFVLIFFSFLNLFQKDVNKRYSFSVVAFLIASCISIYLFMQNKIIYYDIGDFFSHFIFFLDILLFGLFFYIGVVYKDKKVYILAFLQLILYLVIEIFFKWDKSFDIIVDELSYWMFLIINIVGGLIIVYGIKYIEQEKVTEFKKRFFISYLLFFLVIMNFIVVANDILLFFFLFELTTLSSYLLIRFRGDEISIKNSLQALWINQIAGVSILLGCLVALYFDTALYFNEILSNSLFIVVAFFSIAGMIKGAFLPFQKWLLGAMVAPTPVSAMLHSATMVKLAPFLILKLSPILNNSFVGIAISILSISVFVIASYLALSKDKIKEVLGFSTIALLALMVSLASFGTQESYYIALVLMLFHSFTKALLFLIAGALEKVENIKYISELNGIMNKNKKLAILFCMGFILMTLPPFGIFIGKLFSIKIFVGALKTSPYFLINLVGLVIGTALMVLLYFKIFSALIDYDLDNNLVIKHNTIPRIFRYVINLLFILVTILTFIFGIKLFGLGNFLLFLIPALLVIFLVFFTTKYIKFDRVREYSCGERWEFGGAVAYYDTINKQLINYIFGIFFVIVLLSGLLK